MLKAFVLIVALLVARPAHAQTTDDNPFAGFETIVLKNGLRVWYKHMPGQANAALSVNVQAGSDRDPIGKEQLAHFLEHMQFSDHMGLTTQQIKKQIEDRGGVWNGYTSADRTFYFVHIKKEHALFGLDWLYRVLSPHEMKPEVVERERGPVEVEVGAKPREIWDWVNALYLFPSYLRPAGTWRREFNLDTNESRDFYTYRSLRAITPQDLKDFYNRHYAPSQMTVTVIGDVNRASVMTLMDQTFANLKPAAEHESSPTPTDAGRKRWTYFWQFQPNISYNRRIRFANSSAADDVMLTFISYFLEKRLNDRLRFGERKAVYGISAGMVRRGQAAYFFISGTIRPSEFAFATSVIDEELDALRKGNLSPDAFDTDRSALIQQLRVSYATPENVESWAGWDFANRDRHRDFPDVLSAFQTVTQQQVANFTSKHFVPEREFNSTISPVPLSQGAVILAGLALLFGTVRLMRLLLTRPVDMRRIRYVAHFRIPKLMYFTLGGMLILTIAIGLRLAWYAFDQFNVAFLFEQNSFVLQWSVWAFFIAGNVVVLIAGLSLVPSKILVFEDRVLIKYVAYRSVAIPTADIATLSLERFPSVWLNRRLWKCVPFKWGLLTPGIYLKRRNSWSYFFDVRNRKELLDLLSMHMTI